MPARAFDHRHFDGGNGGEGIGGTNHWPDVMRQRALTRKKISRHPQPNRFAPVGAASRFCMTPRHPDEAAPLRSMRCRAIEQQALPFPGGRK
jgi:hypothetical protein